MDVGLATREAKPLFQMIDHVAQGHLRVGEKVWAVGGRREIACSVGLRQWARRLKLQLGQVCVLYHLKTQRDCHRRLDAGATHVALSSVTIGGGEERAVDPHR